MKIVPNEPTVNVEPLTIARSWDGFVSSSSVHGIRFTSPGFSRIRRFIWTLMLVTGFSVLLGSITSTVVEYFRYEVNTVITMVSEREVTFPAVTICNLNTLRRSKFNEASNDANYSQMLNLARILSMAGLKGSQRNLTIPRINGKKVQDMYKYFGHNMNSYEEGGMLLNCTFNEISCNKSFFKPVLTNSGQCYTFNPGGQFGRERFGKEVLTVKQPGSGFGLKIRLVVQANEYVLMPTHEFSAGWKMLIHDQKELPLVRDYGFALSPGTHTLVGLVKRKVLNLEPPYTTACRKEPLETGSAYTLKGCLRICQEKYIYAQCGCYAPINFVDGKDFELCDLEKSIKCVLPALDNFRKHGNKCVCPDPCESVEYTPYLSYAYFPSDVYAVEVANHLVNIGISKSNESALNYFRKNAIELDVFFQQMNHIVIRQSPAKTLRDIYSELGGLLGASLGASFLTFIELFDFIWTCVLRKFEKRREKKTYIESLSQ